MLVDDDESFVDFLSVILRDQFTLFKAYDGLEGLKIFRHERIDMIITDLVMPRLDGFMLITEIRKLSKVPILALSGGSMDAASLDYLHRLGVSAFMSKPFAPEELTEKMKEFESQKALKR